MGGDVASLAAEMTPLTRPDHRTRPGSATARPFPLSDFRSLRKSGTSRMSSRHWVPIALARASVRARLVWCPTARLRHLSR
jgi:hypothetical protein